MSCNEVLAIQDKNPDDGGISVSKSWISHSSNKKCFPRVFEELFSQIVDSQFMGCYPFRSEYPPLEVSGIVQQRLCPPSVTLLHFTRDQDQDNSRTAVGNIF